MTLLTFCLTTMSRRKVWPYHARTSSVLQLRQNTIVADADTIRIFDALEFLCTPVLQRMIHCPESANLGEDCKARLFGNGEKIFFSPRMKNQRKRGGYYRAFLARRSTSSKGTHELSWLTSLRSCSTSFTNAGSDISTASIKSSSISLDIMEAGATIPRRFLSSMMVMGEVLMSRTIA